MISFRSFFKFITITALLLLTFVLVHGSAYVNGDDIDHVIGHHGRSVFLPETSLRWIPNRVFDQYVRGVLGEFLVLLKSSFYWIDFISIYKFVSGMMYSLFLWGVVEYFFFASRYFYKNLTLNKSYAFRVLAYVALWGVFFWVFPWKNQTHFVCYQVPAFLFFVLAVELFAFAIGLTNERLVAGLSLLVYVVSFSLEAYAAELLVYLCLLQFLIFKFGNANNRLRFARGLYFIYMAFPVIAILITVFFSSRADVRGGGATIDILTNLYTISFLSVFLVAMIGLMVFVARGRPFFYISRKVDSFDVLPYVFSLFAISNIVVVLLVSIRSHFNYFDLSIYPWGDLLLPFKIFIVFSIFALIYNLTNRYQNYESFVVISLFIVTTSLYSKCFKRAIKDSSVSNRVQQYYSYEPSSCFRIIDTGLNLESIPTQIRPLPTGNEHGGALNHYREFFSKFYGRDCIPFFR